MRPQLLDVLVCPLTGQQLALEEVERLDGEVVHGVLRSEAADYPIVGGIPVLRDQVGAIVADVRAGRFVDAAARAVSADRPPSRRQQLRAVLAPRASAVGRLQHRPDVRRLAEVLDDPSPLAATGHVYVEERGGVDAFDYFRYRFSIPRHLVALACVEALAPIRGRVLDLGCGVGHLTWALTHARPGVDAVGVDPAFFQLWDARRVAPAADLVCADGAALPFRSSVFDHVMAGDVMSFVPAKWSVAREAERVLVPGGALALTSVINADRHHVYAGAPLSPGGWRSLVSHLPHRLLADDEIVARYLAGRGLATARDRSDDELDRARTITVVAVRSRTHDWLDAADLVGSPHARGPLRINPLYRQRAEGAHGIELERHEPSPTFHADNLQAWTYLPEELHLSWAAVEAAASGVAHAELDAAVGRLGLLSLPEGYPGPAWPSVRTTAGLAPAHGAGGAIR